MLFFRIVISEFYHITENFGWFLEVPLSIKFEQLCEKHRKDVIDILNYYVTKTTAAFRDEVVDYSHFDIFLDRSNVYNGYAITGKENIVIGFCTLEPFKKMNTFLKTAEVMYFIRNDYIGKGIGGKILSKLENDARKHKIKKLIVDISDDNEISIKFHKRNGFNEYGRLNRCWNKFEKDLGIVYMDKDI